MLAFHAAIKKAGHRRVMQHGGDRRMRVQSRGQVDWYPEAASSGSITHAVDAQPHLEFIELLDVLVVGRVDMLRLGDELHLVAA